MTEHNRFAVLAAPDVDMVGEDEMQGNGNPAGVVGAGGMGVRRVSLSSDSDVSGIEEADSQVGPQRSAASSAASSEPDVEMDPGAQFLEAIACPQSDFTYELDGAFLPKDGPGQECFDNRFSVSLPLFLTKTSGGQVALALSTFWHAKWFTRMLNLNTFCYLLPTFVSHAHTLFCPPFFPQRHLVTSIYSMAHGAVIETFLVASRYRYIPNTLGRKRSR